MRHYIVLVSPSSGGAEKRFFDIYTSLRREGVDIGLIAPSSLVKQFQADHSDRADVLPHLLAVPMQGWSRPVFVRRFRELLNSLPRGASFHYPLNCLWPAHLGRGDRVSMSVADCTSVPAPLSRQRTSVWAWISFFFVARIDVLSPAIHSAMRGYRRAPRMSLTPGGTFVVPMPETGSLRRPTVVFLGRLVQGKGLDDLLDVLPSVWSHLQGRVSMGFGFEVAGYGPLQGHVEQRVQALQSMGVPVRFVGYAVAQDLLSSSSVLLSLQETTNYPSRVVAEALMSGCAVIVRDTGDSRAFGDDLPGLLYCAAQLRGDELADQLASLLARASEASQIREAARARFNSPAYLDYFRSLLALP